MYIPSLIAQNHQNSYFSYIDNKQQYELVFLNFTIIYLLLVIIIILYSTLNNTYNYYKNKNI
jgi:hypothetical protein